MADYQSIRMSWFEFQKQKSSDFFPSLHYNMIDSCHVIAVVVAEDCKFPAGLKLFYLFCINEKSWRKKEFFQLRKCPKCPYVRHSTVVLRYLMDLYPSD